MAKPIAATDSHMSKTKSDDSLPQEATDTGTVKITGLLSYHLQLVANLLSRGAAMHYRRRFDTTLWEWRVTAFIVAHPGLSLNELARKVGLDKGLASRVVTSLTEKGIVLRSVDEQDARAVRLTLTRNGEHMYRDLIKAANVRNNIFLGVLTQEEWSVLQRALVKLESVGRDYIEQEKKLAAEEPQTLKKQS
ncbi:MAG: MarR family winged helix-turn-helix transcriptional regulator [Burkholderiaceae bacterium]